MKVASAQATPGKQLSKQQANALRKKKGQAKPAWRPKPLQKFHMDDFVAVLRFWTALALGATFQPGKLGHSLRPYLGKQFAEDLSFVLSCEQNLFVASTKTAYPADCLPGGFGSNSAQGDVSLRSHLKQCNKEVSYGIVSTANHETAETPNDSIQWRQSIILDTGRFRTSNKARLTCAGAIKPRTDHYNSEIITVRTYLWTVRACSVWHCGTQGGHMSQPHPRSLWPVWTTHANYGGDAGHSRV